MFGEMMKATKTRFIAALIAVFGVCFVALSAEIDLSAYPTNRSFAFFRDLHLKPEWRSTRKQVLLITWFERNERSAWLYSVSEDGSNRRSRMVYDWADQAAHVDTLAQSNVTQVLTLCSTLTNVTPQPSIEHLVILSYKKDGEWEMRVLDSSRRSGTLNEIMKILGERPDMTMTK